MGHEDKHDAPKTGQDKREIPPETGLDEHETPPETGLDEHETPPETGRDERQPAPEMVQDKRETPPKMGGDKSPPAPETVQDTAVLGVVIAGVLVSFTIPGPFDWGATLIGVILLVVLVAYGDMPWKVPTWRRAMGMSAAGAFCILQIIGRPFDRVVRGDDAKCDPAGTKMAHRVENCYHLLSRWPFPDITRDEDMPSPDAGVPLLLIWLVFFALLMVSRAAKEGHR